jgi:hypothetical protein
MSCPEICKPISGQDRITQHSYLESGIGLDDTCK